MLQQYPCSVCHKSIVIKKIQFFVIYVNYGFLLNALTSVMLTISIYQAVVILGIVLIVTLEYMLLAIYKGESY